jgi:hypothetical protein
MPTLPRGITISCLVLNNRARALLNRFCAIIEMVLYFSGLFLISFPLNKMKSLTLASVSIHHSLYLVMIRFLSYHFFPVGGFNVVIDLDDPVSRNWYAWVECDRKVL